MNKIKKYSYVFLVFLSCILVVASLLSTLYNNTSIWWMRSLNFPRLQLLIVAVLLLLLLPVVVIKWTWLAKIAMAGLAISLVIHAWFVLPYTFLFKKEVPTIEAASVKPADKLGLFIANVYMKNRSKDKLLQMIEDTNPDILFLVETDKWWQQTMQPVANRYQYKVEYPMDNTYGLLLYSRFQLINPEIKFLEKPNVPSVHTGVVMPNGKQFMLHAEHPVPPVPSKYPDNIGADGEELKEVAAIIAKEQLPSMVAGDLNDVAWSKTSRLFRQDSKMKDIRTGRNFFNSFDANSFIFRWPLDHVFVDTSFRLIKVELLPAFGSDHFPVYTQLALPRLANN